MILCIDYIDIAHIQEKHFNMNFSLNKETNIN